jgi:hypothetical protein
VNGTRQSELQAFKIGLSQMQENTHLEKGLPDCVHDFWSHKPELVRLQYVFLQKI